MASRASIAGHPIHPMLVVFPIGLWVFSLVADLIYAGNHNEVWRDTAYYAMAGGVIGALAAAIPGAIDLFSMTDRDTKRIGIIHMTLNLTIVVLFLINLWWRTQVASEAVGPVWLSIISVGLLLVSGWLGGEMVYVRGAGVSSEAFAPGTTTTTTRVIVERRRPGSGIGYVGPERRVPVHARREY
jgi:uncharacterized membrane protein